MFSPDPPALLASFVPGGANLMVAARITGPAKTAFPDGRPGGDPTNGSEEADASGGRWPALTP
jgi:hypothetical protein